MYVFWWSPNTTYVIWIYVLWICVSSIPYICTCPLYPYKLFPWAQQAIGNHDVHPNKHGRHYDRPTVSKIYDLLSKPSNGCTLSVDTWSNWLGSKPSKQETLWAGQCWQNAMSKSTIPRQSKLQKGIWTKQERMYCPPKLSNTAGNMQHLPPPRQEGMQCVHPNVHGMQYQPNRPVPHPISLWQ